jgi:eukaryotic-like serine/threonine-protein kinase
LGSGENRPALGGERLLPQGNPEPDEHANLFVGRQQELGEIRAAISAALAGRDRILFLTGEPGIGKTRLADEAATHAASRGMRVYWGQCFEDGGAPAYWPWIQILRSLLQPDRHKSAPLAIAQEIGQLIPELSPEGYSASAPPDDPKEARFRLFDAVAAVIRQAVMLQIVQGRR